jgi:hypothetical protein
MALANNQTGQQPPSTRKRVMLLSIWLQGEVYLPSVELEDDCDIRSLEII